MAKPQSRERSIYTLRLAASERALLEAAATQRDLYLSEWIRRVALATARAELAREEAQVSE